MVLIAVLLKLQYLLPSTDTQKNYGQMRKEGFRNVYLSEEELTENKYMV